MDFHKSNPAAYLAHFVTGCAVSAVALPVQAITTLQQYHLHVHNLAFLRAKGHDQEAYQSARRPRLSVKADSAHPMPRL